MHEPPSRDYHAKDFGRLTGTPGFSEKLLSTHFELYRGYVTHTNKCLELLSSKELDPYAATEIRRRLVWEFNGMRLHELYFGGMANGGAELPRDSVLGQAIGVEYGSTDGWWDRFNTLGATRGSGWAVLSYDPHIDRLVHCWVNEHDKGILAGTLPIVVLDLFEHAYMRDYDMDRGGYMGAFRKAIDWNVCEERLKTAKKARGATTTGRAAA